MALLRSLSRLVFQPAVAGCQLSAAAATSVRAGLATQAGAPRQCSSLLNFDHFSVARTEGLRSLARSDPVTLSGGQAAVALWQQCSSRGFVTKLRPRFLGCKLKPYSSYKERFKMTGSGKIRYMRPGSVHKHFNKGNRQNRDLAKTQVLYETYAKTMRKLGFKMRSF